jgi:hypothetical protein
VFNPCWIIPLALINSRVGGIPTIELLREGLRIDPPVSSPMAHVTMFIAMAGPLPALEPPELRVVS